MNFYVDSGGVVLHVTPERIFQGSANANTIRFIGAFASNSPVLVAFKLPNGVWTTPQSMGFSAQLSGVETNDGVQFNTWEYQIPQVVTENYGTVNVQFYVYGDAGGTGGQIASAMSSFVVEKGVPITLPDPTDDYQTLLTQILAVLSQIQSEIGDLPNNYVPRSSGRHIVYVNDINGNPSTQIYAVDASGNIIVQRDGNGQIKVPLAPGQDNDAVPKKYVDNADNTKLNKVEPFANGTYAYIVSKDDQFGTTNGYTEISETDKISTIAKRKTNGCIETRTPYADVEAANKGYVDTAISDTQGQLAQTNQNVEDLYTILEQAQVVTVTTLEQAYTTRETADGENIVDGVQTTVKEIRGKTVATENLIPYPYTETTKTMAGLTYTDNGDGSITVNGTPTDYSAFLLAARLELAGVFTLSGIPVASNLTYTIGFRKSDGVEIDSKTGVNITFNTTDYGDYDYMVINIKRNNNNIAVNNVIVRPMLNAGTEAKPYSKWFAGLKNASFEKIVSTGKNLIDPATIISGYISDADFTISGNKNIYRSIKCYLPAGKYTLQSSVAINIIRTMIDGNYLIVSTENLTSYTFTTTQSGYVGISFRRKDDTNWVDDTNIWLVFSNTATAYEPYISDTLSAENPIELSEYDIAYPETGKTKRQSKTVTFNGTEAWEARGSAGDLYRYGAVLANVKTSGACVANLSGENSGASVAGNYFIDTEFKVFTNIATVEAWKAHLAELAAAGNPLTVTYKTAEATTESTPFNKSKYKAWKNGSETIEQGPTDNSEYGAENTVKQDYFTLTGGTTNV